VQPTDDELATGNRRERAPTLDPKEIDEGAARSSWWRMSPYRHAACRKRLAMMGHEVCGVETTEATAVAAALRHRPDLMIVDARLRGGCGVSAVEAILRTTFVPHLFVSGDAARVQGA